MKISNEDFNKILDLENKEIPDEMIEAFKRSVPDLKIKPVEITEFEGKDMNKMKTEIVKDHWLWETLRVHAESSNCLRKKVSAGLMFYNIELNAIANNSATKGLKGCSSCYRQQNDIKSGTRYETCRAIHAEQRVLLISAKRSYDNETLYVYGHNFICLMCKRAIVEAGIKDVYLRESMDHDVQYFTREEIMKTKGL